MTLFDIMSYFKLYGSLSHLPLSIHPMAIVSGLLAGEIAWLSCILSTDAVFPADIKHSMKFVSLNVTFHSFPIGY